MRHLPPHNVRLSAYELADVAAFQAAIRLSTWTKHDVTLSPRALDLHHERHFADYADHEVTFSEYLTVAPDERAIVRVVFPPQDVAEVLKELGLPSSIVAITQVFFPLSSFPYNGAKYYQQYRKCSNKRCWCMKDTTMAQLTGHGPYWYRRQGGKVQLLGVELPEPMATYADRIAKADQVVRSRQREIDACLAFTSGHPLSEGDIAVLQVLGIL